MSKDDFHQLLSSFADLFLDRSVRSGKSVQTLLQGIS